MVYNPIHGSVGGLLSPSGGPVPRVRVALDRGSGDLGRRSGSSIIHMHWVMKGPLLRSQARSCFDELDTRTSMDWDGVVVKLCLR